MRRPKTKTVCDLKAHTRYKDPYNNLLYCLLLQAVDDNDIDYLRHGVGLIIWRYLKTVKE